MPAPAGVYVITAVMRNSRPYAIAAKPTVINHINILIVILGKGVKFVQHTLYRLGHGKVSPAARSAPYCVLVAEIIGIIAIFPYPHRARNSIVPLNKTVFFHSAAEHSGVVFAICYIGRTVIRRGIARRIWKFLVHRIMKRLLNFKAHLRFV